MGDQPERDLGVRLAGHDCLPPGPVCPPHIPLTSAVGRAQIRSSVLYPASPLAARLCPASASQRFLVEWQPGEHLPLRRAQRLYAVVETWQGDPAVGIVQAGQQRGERVQRVRHPAAERARVQVGVRTGQVDLARRSGRACRCTWTAHPRPTSLCREMTITSQRSASRRARSSSAKCGDPDSSSPSIRNFSPTGGAMRCRGREAGPQAQRVKEHLALVVGGAAGESWPSRSTGSNGGESHSLSGSTGWTS